jgi:iron complex outermembrane receptor protein
MTFEQLAELTVVTVSKKEEPLFRAPAAVAVLTAEDLRRSGAMTLTEALRWVPGLDVAQASTGAWAVSARGFHAVSSNKMLVMIDGASAYLPLVGGVFNYTIYDPLQEEIERIEVVRGPGASVWGANAVNGVINVVTKPAKETLGTMIYGGAGTERQRLAGMMVGVKVGEKSWLRVTARYDALDDSVLVSGLPGDDSLQNFRAGFRWDGEPQPGTSYTIQGNGFTNPRERRVQLPSFTAPGGRQTVEGIVPGYGGHLMGRWEREDSADSKLVAQAYVDDGYFDNLEYTYRWQTVDFDLQRNFHWGGRHEAAWGLSYRWYHDRATGSFENDISITPEQKEIRLFSAFGQEEMRFAADRVSMLFGAKVENHTYGGWQIQPTVRLAWTPTDSQTIWGAASRAARSPARTETGIRLVNNIAPAGVAGPLPVMAVTNGTPGVDAEELWAFELGYRRKVGATLTLAAATYANLYDRLLSVTQQAPVVVPGGTPPHVLVDFNYMNALRGESYGLELDATWTPRSDVQFRAMYTFKRLFLHSVLSGATVPVFVQNGEGDIPEHTAGLRVSWNPAKEWQVDANVRAVSRLTAQNIAGYAELDLQFVRSFGHEWEAGLTGQNLLHRQHAEFRNALPSVPPHEVQRGVYFKVTRRY